MQCRADDARAAGWEGHYSFFCSSTADLLPAHSGCNARLSKSIDRKPTSTGRLRVGYPETRVEWAFQPGVAGNARKHWAGRQGLRKCPFYAGFGAGTVAGVVAVRQARVKFAVCHLPTGDGSAPNGFPALCIPSLPSLPNLSSLPNLPYLPSFACLFASASAKRPQPQADIMPCAAAATTPAIAARR